MRVDAPLYFANAEYLKEKLERVAADREEDLQVLVFDMSSVNDIDSSADRALHELADDFEAQGIDLYLASVKGLVRDVMRRSGLYEHLGADRFFLSTDEAVRAAETRLMADAIPLETAPRVIVIEEKL